MLTAGLPGPSHEDQLGFGSTALGGLLLLPDVTQRAVAGVSFMQFSCANWGICVQWRKRGAAAQGAGTGFRNRHWTTAFANSKHVPMSFKAVPLNLEFIPPDRPHSALHQTLMAL